MHINENCVLPAACVAVDSWQFWQLILFFRWVLRETGISHSAVSNFLSFNTLREKRELDSVGRKAWREESIQNT
jgi:hypothetical protein